MSHSFPQSLVLCWLCSCFPLRSGTLDDGRPRYELCSFFPPFLLCPSCFHYALTYMCLWHSGDAQAWSCTDMSCLFILNDLVDFHSPNDFFFLLFHDSFSFMTSFSSSCGFFLPALLGVSLQSLFNYSHLLYILMFYDDAVQLRGSSH